MTHVLQYEDIVSQFATSDNAIIHSKLAAKIHFSISNIVTGD